MSKLRHKIKKQIFVYRKQQSYKVEQIDLLNTCLIAMFIEYLIYLAIQLFGQFVQIDFYDNYLTGIINFVVYLLLALTILYLLYMQKIELALIVKIFEFISFASLCYWGIVFLGFEAYDLSGNMLINILIVLAFVS